MSTQYIAYSSRTGGVPTYPTAASLPSSASDGALAITLDTDTLYVFNLGSMMWLAIGAPSAVLSIGVIDSQAPGANGATLNIDALIMQSASVSFPGLVNNTTQSFSGDKTFTGAISASNLSGTNTGDVTLGTANGLSILGQVLSLQLSNATHTGALSSADWNTFNSKQPAGSYITDLTGEVTASGPGSAVATISNGVVTNAKLADMADNTVKANKSGVSAAPSDLALSSVVEAVSAILTITNGSNSVVASSDLSIEVQQSDATHDGYLSSTDWNTFNNKQDALTFGDLTDVGTDGITVTGGTGAVIGSGTSLSQHVADATHNGYLSSSDWSTFNAKQPAGSYITALTGDVTASGPGSSAATIANLAVTNAKIANATIDLTAKVTGILPIANGGTNAATANAAFNNLSPLTTKGDLIAYSTVNARLPVGTDGQMLVADSTQALGVKWANSGASGVTTIGTFNSQSSSADGLVISGNNLYAQAATSTNPGMVIIPSSSSALSLSGASLSVAVDSSTISINGSNQLEAIQPLEEQITLSGTDITNQYVDLQHTIFGASNSDNSATLWVVGSPMQLKGVDYTVDLTGGSGGVTRITFAGDLATGGPAALIAGDILVINYSYLA